MWKRIWTAAAMALLLGSSSSTPVAAGGRSEAAYDDWAVARTERFQVIGDASRSELKKIARQLEAADRVLERVFPQVHVISSVPIRVFVNCESEIAEKLIDCARPDGYGRRVTASKKSERGSLLLLDAHAEKGVGYEEAIAAHVCLMLGQHAPGYPLWMNRALQWHFSEFRLSGSRAFVGGMPRAHKLVLSDAVHAIPLERMLTVGRQDYAYSEEYLQRLFDAQSQVLLNWIRHRSTGGHSPLADYLERVWRGDPVRKAAEAAFGEPFPDLERSYHRALSRGGFEYDRFDLESRPRAVVERLEAADAASRLGWLTESMCPDQPHWALEHYLSALELEPGHSEAAAGVKRFKASEDRTGP